MSFHKRNSRHPQEQRYRTNWDRGGPPPTQRGRGDGGGFHCQNLRQTLTQSRGEQWQPAYGHDGPYKDISRHHPNNYFNYPEKQESVECDYSPTDSATQHCSTPNFTRQQQQQHQQQQFGTNYNYEQGINGDLEYISDYERAAAANASYRGPRQPYTSRGSTRPCYNNDEPTLWTRPAHTREHSQTPSRSFKSYGRIERSPHKHHGPSPSCRSRFEKARSSGAYNSGRRPNVNRNRIMSPADRNGRRSVSVSGQSENSYVNDDVSVIESNNNNNNNNNEQDSDNRNRDHAKNRLEPSVFNESALNNSIETITISDQDTNFEESFNDPSRMDIDVVVLHDPPNKQDMSNANDSNKINTGGVSQNDKFTLECNKSNNKNSSRRNSATISQKCGSDVDNSINVNNNDRRNCNVLSNNESPARRNSLNTNSNSCRNSINIPVNHGSANKSNTMNLTDFGGRSDVTINEEFLGRRSSLNSNSNNQRNSTDILQNHSIDESNTVNASKNSQRNSDISLEKNTSQARYNISDSNINRVLENINMLPNVVSPLDISNIPSMQKNIKAGNKRSSSDTFDSTQEQNNKLLKVDLEEFNTVPINQSHIQQQSTNQLKNEAAESSNVSGEKIQNDSIRQLKSVLLVLHRRLQNNFKVSLLTDVSEPKYLRDAVFCFEKTQSISGNIGCTLFKVKYIISNESNPFPKINYRTLSSPDFNITEYYRQYLAYAKNLSCQQNNKEVTNIIFYSNLELNVPTFENNDIAVRQVDENKYKLVVNEKSKIFKVLLEKSSDLPILAKLIADYINTGNPVILKGILKKYHMALVIENIIKIKISGGSGGKKKQKFFGEFHRNFIEGRYMTETAKELRQLLVKYLGRQLCETMKLVVNRNFGEDFIFENNPEVSNIDKLATELTTVISSSLAMPTENILFRKSPSLKDDLRKITVHILEKGMKDSVVFSKNFLNYSVDLPGNLNLLRDIIKNKLTAKKINFSDIGICKFKINEFRDKETIGVMKHLPIGDNQKFVNDFLAKLVFIVNKQDVDYLIRRAIGQEFELIRDETSAINIQNELFKWFQSNNENVDPFTLIKRKISKTVVANRSVNRCKFPETIIEFKPEVLIKIKNRLIDITDHFMVFKSNCICLTILKISQVTKSIPEYSDNDQCMLVKSNILSGMPDHVIKAFESRCTNLLVFEFDKNWIKIENIADTVKTLRNIATQQGGMKKLLLVINHLQFTEDSNENYPIITDMCRLSDATKESQVKLLEKVVKVHSRRMRLKDFMNVNMLSKLIRTSQLLTQIMNDNILIGEPIVAPLNFDDDCYIPACIKRLVIINHEIFRDSIDDIFVISNIEKAELLKFLPSGEKICHIYELDFDMGTEVRFILLSGAESDLGFDNITSKNSTKNIHLLRYESRAFVWQRSSGSIVALVKYKAEETDYLQQPKIIQDILADGTAGEKIIIVSGETGMGKSVYLHKLAERSLASSASALNPLWVIRLELSNAIMQDHERQVFRDNAEAVHFFTRLLNYDTLGQNFFALSANGGMHLRLALFLDGYDELRREYADVVGNLINQLRNTNIERIYVTARPSSAASLETKLNTFSYELCSLNNENKIDYLVRHWRKGVESCPEASLHEHARRLLDNHGSVDRTIDLTSSPQQLKMLAQIYSRYLRNTGHEYTTVHLQDHHDLYKRYVEMEGRWDDWSKLQTAALRRLLTPTEQHYLGLAEESKDDVDELPSVFCHWTFVEYFAANYLWQKSRSADQEATILRCCDSLVENTSPVFLSTLVSLFRLDSQDSLSYFDQLLARHGHVRFLRALPKTQLTSNGLGDQTALHQAAEAGQLETVRLLLERHNDTGARNVLMHGEFARAEYAESSLVKFINRPTRQGKTAVQLTRVVAVACELALMGADLSHVDTLILEKMALHAGTEALQGGRLQQVAEKLLRLAPRAAAQLNREDQCPKLLAYFFARGRVEVIERLLEVLGDETERYRLLEAGDCNGTFLDHVNCSSTLRDEERLEVTRFLVDKIGWSLGKKDKLYLWSVLHAAARHQHVRTFDFFVGQYPRHHAGFLERCLLTNELETIEFLLRNRERTVDPKTGDPALHTAVRLGASLPIIRVLVDKDGVNNINNDGENALCVAIKTGQNLSLIEYLMDKGANATTEDKLNLYPWCYAILEEKSKYSNEQQHEIMRYFLRKSNGRMPRLLAHDKSYSYGKWRLEVERKLEFFERIDSYNQDRVDKADEKPRLHKAISSGELAWCRFLVAQQTADVNVREMQQGRTSLHVACVFRRYDLARHLLQNGASFDAIDFRKRTALQLAEGDANMRALLQQAVELFSSGKKLKDEISVEKSKWSKSPLRYLLGCRNKEARTLIHVAADTNTRLRALIKFGEEINEKYPDCKRPDINARDLDGNTAMHLAASKGYKNCVIDLVDEGAHYNAENVVGKTPRDLATENGHKDTADLLGLIDKIFLAVKARKLEDIKSCLSQEKKLVNARNSLGQSILHLACGLASIDIVNYLVSASNARIAGVDLALKTPLHNAAESDSEACVEALLRAGAPLDPRDREARRPLDVGDPRRSRAIQLLQTLHELFADLLSDEPRIFASEERIAERLKYVSVAPSTRDSAKNTLLHHAVRLHYLPAARALLRFGAAYNAKNAQRKAPVELIPASAGGNSELERLLGSVAKLFRHQDVEFWARSGVEKEIIVRCRKAGGCTLLHNAAKEKKKLEFKWLLNKGADPAAVDNKGRRVEICDVL